MTQSMDCSEARLSLGVYVLGAIDPDERAQVDAHLAGCAECRAELAELEGLPALLAQVSTEEAIALAATDGPPDAAADVAAADVAAPTVSVPADEAATDEASDGQPAEETEAAAPSEEMLGAVLDLTAARRRRRWREAILGVAAAIIVAAGVFGGLRFTSAPVQSAQANSSNPYYGPAGGPWEVSTGGSHGMAATVMYRPMGWGTQLAARIEGIPLGTKCKMWVIGPGNSRVLAGSWVADANEGSVWYPASAAVSPAQVQTFVISVGNTRSITIDASLAPRE
jgi:anti-sigma factor RsiW